MARVLNRRELFRRVSVSTNIDDAYLENAERAVVGVRLVGIIGVAGVRAFEEGIRDFNDDFSPDFGDRTVDPALDERAGRQDRGLDIRDFNEDFNILDYAGGYGYENRLWAWFRQAIQPWLCYAVGAELCWMTGLKMGNAGVVKTQASGVEQVTAGERDMLRAHYERLADGELRKLKEWLRAPRGRQFLSLVGVELPESYPVDVDATATGGIFLGGGRGKRTVSGRR